MTEVETEKLMEYLMGTFKRHLSSVMTEVLNLSHNKNFRDSKRGISCKFKGIYFVLGDHMKQICSNPKFCVPLS